jgi:hypothetical protein
MDDQDKTDVYPPCSPRLCAKSGTDQQKQPKKNDETRRIGGREMLQGLLYNFTGKAMVS